MWLSCFATQWHCLQTQKLSPHSPHGQVKALWMSAGKTDTDHRWVVCPTAFCISAYSCGPVQIPETRATMSRILNSSPNTVYSVLSTSSDQGLWSTRPKAGDLLQLTYQTHKAHVIFTLKRVKYLQLEHILWSELETHGQDVNRVGYDPHSGTAPKLSSILNLHTYPALFRLNVWQLATPRLLIACKFLK